MESKMVATAKNPFLDVSKALADFKVPGIDVESLVASQRKNIEAFTQANQLAVEGVQALVRRQVEIARQTMDDLSQLVRDSAQLNGSPEERIAKSAEFSKSFIEKGVSNARELTEMVAKANTEAFNVLNKRVTETLDEVRDFASKKKVAAR
jgi:phasin family protein